MLILISATANLLHVCYVNIVSYETLDKDIVITKPNKGNGVVILDWKLYSNTTLRKKCPYSKLFWSTFSRIRTEYGEIRSISTIQSKCGKMRTRITPNKDTFIAGLFRKQFQTHLNSKALMKTQSWNVKLHYNCFYVSWNKQIFSTKMYMANCILLVFLLLVSMVLLKCTDFPLVIHFLNFIQLFHL